MAGMPISTERTPTSLRTRRATLRRDLRLLNADAFAWAVMTGCGEAYFVADEGTRKAQGTGLGLHLVSQYCRAMRARLALEDRPGGGLLVRVRFRVS